VDNRCLKHLRGHQCHVVAADPLMATIHINECWDKNDPLQPSDAPPYPKTRIVNHTAVKPQNSHNNSNFVAYHIIGTCTMCTTNDLIQIHLIVSSSFLSTFLRTIQYFFRMDHICIFKLNIMTSSAMKNDFMTSNIKIWN
jgi:hypothetical protein